MTDATRSPRAKGATTKQQTPDTVFAETTQTLRNLTDEVIRQREELDLLRTQLSKTTERAAGAGFLLSRVSPIDHQLVGEDKTHEDQAKADCDCDAAQLGMSADYHDRLLSSEELGGAGAWMDLVEHMRLSSDGGDLLDEGERLHWTAYEAFVAQHNWRDPVAVARLVSFVTDALQRRADPDGVGSVSVTEAARALGLDASGMQRLIDEGEISYMTIGARRVVPVSELAKLSEELDGGGV